MYDNKIEEVLKEIGSEIVYDYYKILSHKSIIIGDLLPHKSQENVINEINQSLKSNTIDSEQKKRTCHALNRLFPPDQASLLYIQRCLIYDISKKIFKNETLEKKYLEKWSPEIWEISDQLQTQFIVEEIACLKNLMVLSKSLGEDINDSKSWISNLIDLILKSDWKDLLEGDSSI